MERITPCNREYYENNPEALTALSLFAIYNSENSIKETGNITEFTEWLEVYIEKDMDEQVSDQETKEPSLNKEGSTKLVA